MFLDPCIIIKFIKKNPTRCNNVSTFYYSIFIWSSTFFGRQTAHHQEPKTALAASGFSYVEGCWTCSWWTLSGTGCQCSFRLLMMGGVSSEKCWASYKYGIIKFWYTVASGRIFNECYEKTFHYETKSAFKINGETERPNSAPVASSVPSVQSK